MTSWMMGHAPLMAFIYWADMLMPILLVSVYLNTIACHILKYLGADIGNTIYEGPMWLMPVFAVLGCYLGFGIRHIRAFRNLPWFYFLLIPVLVLILSFLMAYIRIAGLMRCADGTGWGTRVLEEEDLKNCSGEKLLYE